MRILVSYRGIAQSPGWATGDFVVNALRKLGHEVYPYANIYQREDRVEGYSKEELLSLEYDLTLFMECNDADPQYLELRRRNGLRAKSFVSWFFDTSYYSDHLKYLAAYLECDVSFIANPMELRRFKSAHYLPYGFDPEKHFREYRRVVQNEFALFGTIRPDRLKLVAQAKKAGLTIGLIEGVYRDEYVNALSRTAVTVNQNPKSGAGLLNMRTFEAPAAGSLLMFEMRDYLANPGLFIDGENCCVFSNAKDLIRKCIMLRSDIALREKLRNQGQANILANHTYECRCIEILETI